MWNQNEQKSYLQKIWRTIKFQKRLSIKNTYIHFILVGARKYP